MAGVMSVAACQHSGAAAPVRVVDLIHDFASAERRPPTGSRVAIQSAGGVARPAIVVPAPSRITWSVPLPRHGVLRTFVALEGAAPGVTAPRVTFRIGISDYRIYEGLTQITVTPQQQGWLDLRADLSDYAGWKWSLFYHPDRVIWRVVLAADNVAGGPAMAAWGSPEIITDTTSAREYVVRARQLRGGRGQ
jgi:hypothetical protein